MREGQRGYLDIYIYIFREEWIALEEEEVFPFDGLPHAYLTVRLLIGPNVCVWVGGRGVRKRGARGAGREGGGGASFSIR